MRGRAPPAPGPAVTGAPRALARRYARALLDVAGRPGTGRHSRAARRAARVRGVSSPGTPELQRALRTRGSARSGGAACSRRGREAGATDLLRRLVDLLAVRDRLALLPDVADAYAEAANAAHGVVSAEAVSAVPLGEPSERPSPSPRGDGGAADPSVEPGLLGGVLVRVGGRTYDGTVRARLAALRRRLAAASPGPAGTSGSARTR